MAYEGYKNMTDAEARELWLFAFATDAPFGQYAQPWCGGEADIALFALTLPASDGVFS